MWMYQSARELAMLSSVTSWLSIIFKSRPRVEFLNLSLMVYTYSHTKWSTNFHKLIIGTAFCNLWCWYMCNFDCRRRPKYISICIWTSTFALLSISHTETKKYKCTHCKKHFSQNINLKSHSLVHTGGNHRGVNIATFVCSCVQELWHWSNFK